MFELTTLQVCQVTALLLAFFLVGTVVCTVGLAVTLARQLRRCRDCPHCRPVPVPGAGEVF